jgi:hypothetical protein
VTDTLLTTIEKIAAQKTTDELEAEDITGDLETGYNTIVKLARDTLAQHTAAMPSNAEIVEMSSPYGGMRTPGETLIPNGSKGYRQTDGKIKFDLYDVALDVPKHWLRAVKVKQ